MHPRSRDAIGRMTAAIAVIAVVVVAVGVGGVLTTQGGHSSTSASTSSTSSTTSTSLTSSTTTSSTTTSSTTSSITSSSTTTSSSSTSTGCTFNPPSPAFVVNFTKTAPSFTGCLAADASGQYVVNVTDKYGVILLGSISASNLMNVTITSIPSGNLTSKVAYGPQNAQKLDGFHNIYLPGLTSYAIMVVNDSNQNNTMTITLLFYDANSYGGQG